MTTPPHPPRPDVDAPALASALPNESVRRTVEGALRFLEQATQLDPRSDALEFTEKLERLGALARELRDDREPDGPSDVDETRRALYAFVERCVGDALAQGTTEPVAAARDALAAQLLGRAAFASREAV